MQPQRRGRIATSRERGRPARWVVIGLVAYVAAVVAVLVLPIGYSQIVGSIGDWLRSALGASAFGDGWIELGANVLLFVPLGLLLTLLLRRHWHGVMLALILSASAELAQLIIPARQPSVRDILANVLGAAIGSALAWTLVVRRERVAAAPHGSPHALDRAGEPVAGPPEPRAPSDEAPN